LALLHSPPPPKWHPQHRLLFHTPRLFSFSLQGWKICSFFVCVKMCAWNRKIWSREGNLTHTSSWWRFIPEREGGRASVSSQITLLVCIHQQKSKSQLSLYFRVYKRICCIIFFVCFSPFFLKNK
jgi:hypothetical protein